MIIVEKNRVTIKVKVPEGRRHAFVQGLYNDLVELMNFADIMQKTPELNDPFKISFHRIKLLQEACRIYLSVHPPEGKNGSVKN